MSMNPRYLLFKKPLTKTMQELKEIEKKAKKDNVGMWAENEESDNEILDNTPLYTVPEGHYFLMGDNRDNSQDSRVSHVVGFVPYENIVGRADFLFFSTDGSAGLFEIWKWPWSLRYNRFFGDIDPIRPPAEETDEATAQSAQE